MRREDDLDIRPPRVYPGHGYSRSRARRNASTEEEYIELDRNSDVNDNVRELLIHLIRHDVPKSRKLAYLNAFVKYFAEIDTHQELNYSDHQILCSLRCCLLHRYSVVRTAALRALRYFVRRPDHVEHFFKYKLDWAVMRCLDIHFNYEMERNQAVLLVRHLCHTNPSAIQPSLIFPFIAFADDGGNDRMVLTSLELLTELAFTNPNLLVRSRGLIIILQYIIESHDYSRVTEGLVLTLLHLVNQPETRKLCGKDLQLNRLLAPFTDPHYKHKNDTSKTQADIMEERQLRCEACRRALVTILHSWPGLVMLASPNIAAIPSLVGALQLEQCASQKTILSLLYQMFMLETPLWTDSFDKALAHHDSGIRSTSRWSLREGFVAAECLHFYSGSSCRVNLIDNHLSLLLSTFLSHHILETLCEVISKSDAPTSIWATLLVGEILYMSYQLLPWQDSEPTHFLPILVTASSSSSHSPSQRLQAHQAVAYLDRVHSTKKKRWNPSSLHLETLISYIPPKRASQKLSSSYSNLTTADTHGSNESEDTLTVMIKNSMILVESQPEAYNWGLIHSVLSSPTHVLSRLDDVLLNRFLSKLLQFFNPKTVAGYSTIKLSHPRSRLYTTTGMMLLVKTMELTATSDLKEADRNMKELLFDICFCLSEIRSELPHPDVKLGLNNVFSYCSQNYFLFIGKLSSSSRGMELLETSGIVQQLMDLVTITSHECYVKLIISSLDYTRDTVCRVILSKALTATSEDARIYAADLMRSLHRLEVPFFSSWCMDLLVKQLHDQSKRVALRALSVIDEACCDKSNLITLIEMKPSILHLGEYGTLLFTRYVSVLEGFNFLNQHGFIAKELENWHQSFNEIYVDIVDRTLAEAFTSYEKNLEGTDIMRKSSLERAVRRNAYLPAHLYGQLVQHGPGAELISELPSLKDVCDTVMYLTVSSEVNVRQSKAALWALGHIGSSIYGLRILEQRRIIPVIANIAEKADHLTIRGTAFYVLGLIASTQAGVARLAECGWRSVMNDRSQLWPILTEQIISHDPEAVKERSMSGSSSSATGAKSDRSGTFDDEGHRSRASTDEERLEVIRTENESLLDKTTEGNVVEVREGKAHSTSELQKRTVPHHFRSSSDSLRTWRPEDAILHENSTHDGSQENGLADSPAAKPIRKTPVKSAIRRTSVVTQYSGASLGLDSSQISTKVRSLSWKNDVRQFSGNMRSDSILSNQSSDSALSKSYSPHDVMISGHLDSDASLMMRYANGNDNLDSSLSLPSIRKRLTSLSSNSAAGSTINRGSYTKRKDEIASAALRAMKSQVSTMSSDQGVSTMSTNSLTHSTFNKQSLLRSMSYASDIDKLNEARKISDSNIPILFYSDNQRYMGLALPSEVSLMFRLPVIETSSVPSTPSIFQPLGSIAILPANQRRPSIISGAHALELHSNTNCLLCVQIQNVYRPNDEADLSPLSPEALEAEDEVSTVLMPLPNRFLERQQKLESNMHASTDPNIVTAPTNKKHRNALRKECIKFITTISGMIGSNAAEEGLLRLREQFPELFDDLCLYSEVCAILSTYSYHLPARRFIQELFQETNFSQLITKTQMSLNFDRNGPCCSKHIQPKDSTSSHSDVVIVHDGAPGVNATSHET